MVLGVAHWHPTRLHLSKWYLVAMQAITLMTLLAVASGCSGDKAEVAAGNEAATTSVACTQRPRNWPHPPRGFIGTGIAGLNFSEIEVRPNGSIRLNNKEIDFPKAQEYLGILAEFITPPLVVLRTSEQSHCETAERVRKIMDSLQMCRKDMCFESATWDALGLPTFEAHSNRFNDKKK